MGSYRQHVGVASMLGASYAWALYALAGIHWVYGSVAALLATLGGLLPDLDSQSGVSLRGFTGLLGVLAAVAVWQNTSGFRPPLTFELHLWLVILTYLFVRHALRRVLAQFTTHRGMSHSLPTALVWACLTYLVYPSEYHPVRLAMALAMLLGFLSHLLLDEVCSVDLSGARVNRAFGTALKFWASSAWATVGMYVLLAYLAWRVIEQWPEDPAGFATRVPAPVVFLPELPDWMGEPRIQPR